MPRRPVADHAVGGVDRLVDRGTRQAGHGEPEGRRDDAVGKILRQALDGGARHARFVEVFRVAPDDHGDSLAAAFQPVPLQRVGDGFNMAGQAALCDERTRDEGRGDDAHTRAERRLHEQARRTRRQDEDDQREDTGCPSRAKAPVGAVERRIGPCDQPADPGDGVADRSVEGIGIADGAFDQERQECEQG